jgi:RimJ/RimL family protein N-acetyltransferase
MNKAPPGSRLQTNRLILRPPTIADFPRWAEMMTDPQAARFLGGAQAPETTWRVFMTMAGAWSLTGIGMFSVIDQETGLWLGRVGPWRPLGWPGNEIGWGLHPDAQGRGVALEAAAAAMTYAFDALGWVHVIHCIAPHNGPSQRLAERLGSRRLGPAKLPPPGSDAVVERWGQSRLDWLNGPLAKAGETVRFPATL